MKISLILPIYNEQATLREVLDKYMDELKHLAKANKGSYEIIAVNDGCTDTSLDILMKEAKLNRSLKIINLNQRYGKEAAVTAGFEMAGGDIVILADVTLLNPTGILERMVGEYIDGHEIVYGYREAIGWENMKHSMSHTLINFACRVFKISGEYTGRANIMLFSRSVADVLVSLPHKNKFMRTMDNWTGYDIETVLYASCHSKEEVRRKTRESNAKLKREGCPKVHRSKAREHTPSIIYSITCFIMAIMFIAAWAVLNRLFVIDLWWHFVGLLSVLVTFMCSALFYARAVMIKRIGTVHQRDEEILYEVANVVNG